MKNIYPYFFVVSYLFIIVSPSFGAVDKADTQWFLLAFINLLALTFNIFRFNSFQIPKAYFSLFTFFLFTSSLSLICAINPFEGLFTLLNYLNIFITIFNLYLLISSNLNIIKHILYLITTLLCIELFFIYDSYFENLNDFDRSILSGTSGNVIISSFSVLLKLPFIFYLFLNQKSYPFKFIFIVIISLSCYYILFLSGTRSAFIALVLMFLIVFIFNSSRFIKNLKFIIPSFLIIVFLIYKFSTRIFVFFDSSTSARIRYYIEAVSVFFSSPLYGIGIGNWQIVSLLKDKFFIEEYQVPMFVHNDYLQVLAESGIFAFISFLSIIIFPFYVIKDSLNFKTLNLYIILSIVVFSIDLFFNFPLSRPTILIFYTLSISLFLVLNKDLFSTFSFKKLNISIVLFFATILVFIFSFLHFNFSKEQKIVLYDFNVSDYTTNFAKVSQFKSNKSLLGPTAIPLSSNLSKYYLENDSIALAVEFATQGIKANPYHTLSYDVLSKSYEKLNELDSAYFYAKKSFNLSPRNVASSSQFMVILEKKEKISELDSVFQLVKNYNHDIDWLNYIKIHSGLKIKSKQEIVSLINKALKLFPGNKDFIIQRSIIVNGAVAIENANYFDQKARSEFSKFNFQQAYEYWLNASNYLPNEFAYIQNMASCLVNLLRFQEAIDLLLSIPEEDYPINGRVEFILGTAYNKLGINNKACYWLDKGIKKGDTGALNVYNQVCN